MAPRVSLWMVLNPRCADRTVPVAVSAPKPQSAPRLRPAPLGGSPAPLQKRRRWQIPVRLLHWRPWRAASRSQFASPLPEPLVARLPRSLPRGPLPWRRPTTRRGRAASDRRVRWELIRAATTIRPCRRSGVAARSSESASASPASSSTRADAVSPVIDGVLGAHRL